MPSEGPISGGPTSGGAAPPERTGSPAFALGSLGCCCGCTVTFIVDLCFCTIAGATVTVKSGSTTIASGTTDSTGHLVLDIGSAGTYDVIIAVPGFGSHTFASQALTCKSIAGYNFNIDLTVDICVCCHVVPRTLTLTDDQGAHAFVLTTDAFGFSAYRCTVSVPVMGVTLGVDAFGNCVCSVAASGNLDVDYIGQFTSDCKFMVSRSWRSTGCGTITGGGPFLPCGPAPPVQFLFSSTCFRCIGAGNSIPGIGSDSATAIPSSWSPFTWAGSMAPVPGLPPMGPSVTVTG